MKGKNRSNITNAAVECYVGKFEKNHDVAANEGLAPLYIISTADDMHNRVYAYHPYPDHVLNQDQIDNRRCIIDGKIGRSGSIIIRHVL